MLYLKRILVGAVVLLLFGLVACGGSNTSTGDVSTPAATQPQTAGGTSVLSTPIVSTPVASTPGSGSGTPGIGPIIILTPTPVPGGSSQSQLVKLSDRTLEIKTVSKQPGADASSTAISLTMTITNTGTTTIMNEASYYRLVAAEGDVFGLQSSATASFFGTIAPHSSRSGTIVFQVPTGAVNGLRLLYRSEIATETVFVPLNV